MLGQGMVAIVFVHEITYQSRIAARSLVTI